MARAHVELLSTVRDAAIGNEALRHGADAVTIGGPGFAASGKATSSVTDIEPLFREAHRYPARGFVPLNTILRDDELEPARRLDWPVHAASVDALIVQDMGLLQLDLQTIQLRASTQTDTRTLRFDCKRSEMHAVGRMREAALRDPAVAPVQVYRTRPAAAAAARD